MSLPSDKPDRPRGVMVQKQGLNIYTVMLILAFLAIVIACVFLLLEMKTYDYDFSADGAKFTAAVSPLAQFGQWLGVA